MMGRAALIMVGDDAVRDIEAITLEAETKGMQRVLPTYLEFLERERLTGLLALDEWGYIPQYSPANHRRQRQFRFHGSGRAEGSKNKRS